MRFSKQDVLRSVDNDIEFLQELYGLFLKDLPRCLDEMRSHLESGKVSDLGKVAHFIKGALANLGGLDARDAAFKIERQAKTNDLSDMGLAVQNLENEIKGFCSEIENFFSEVN